MCIIYIIYTMKGMLFDREHSNIFMSVYIYIYISTMKDNDIWETAKRYVEGVWGGRKGGNDNLTIFLF